MWTQRDQVQAYQFLRRRLVSALVAHDANHPVSTSRRLVLGSILGVVAAVLVCGVFGVIGFLHPAQSDDWRKGGQVIVEKETGTRFVLTKDGRLHPVINYASARLLAGGDGAATTTVPADTLASVPRGGLLGIPGAPDSVPAPDRLITSDWTTCSQLPADRPSTTAPSTTLLLSGPGHAAPLGGRALVVTTGGSSRYVVTATNRYRATDDALTALGLDGVSPTRVSVAWLSAVPAGRDLEVLEVDDAGDPGPRVGDMSTRVGQVLVVSVGPSSRYYVVTKQGLASASSVQAALVLAGPSADDAYDGSTPTLRRSSAADVARVNHVATNSPSPADGGYPASVPQPATVADGAAVCVTAGASATVTVATSLPLPSGAKAIAAASTSDPRVAQQIYVPPGHGALVAEQATGGAATGTVYLVTDAGEKFALPSSSAISALGFASTARHPVPAAMIDLLPSGPTLNPADAARELTTTAAK